MNDIAHKCQYALMRWFKEAGVTLIAFDNPSIRLVKKSFPQSYFSCWKCNNFHAKNTKCKVSHLPAAAELFFWVNIDTLHVSKPFQIVWFFCLVELFPLCDDFVGFYLLHVQVFCQRLRTKFWRCLHEIPCLLCPKYCMPNCILWESFLKLKNSANSIPLEYSCPWKYQNSFWHFGYFESWIFGFLDRRETFRVSRINPRVGELVRITLLVCLVWRARWD